MRTKKRTGDRRPRPAPAPAEAQELREKLAHAERRNAALILALQSATMEKTDRTATGLWGKYFIEVCRAADVHLSADMLIYTETARSTLVLQCERLVKLARRAMELDQQISGFKGG